MNVNGKKILAEAIPEIGGKGRERRMVEEVNSRMIYLLYCKNLCKCLNVSLPSTTKKLKESKMKQMKLNLII
jgi:hypothetical protein